LRSILPSTGTQSSTVEEYTVQYRNTEFNSWGVYCPVQEHRAQQLSILPSTGTLYEYTAQYRNTEPNSWGVYCPVQEHRVQQLRSILPNTGTGGSTVEEYIAQYRNTGFNRWGVYCMVQQHKGKYSTVV
jgi:hypothetical protein